MKLEFGKLVDGIMFLPTFGIVWFEFRGKRYYDFRMQWLKWFGQTDNWRIVEKTLEKEREC